VWCGITAITHTLNNLLYISTFPVSIKQPLNQLKKNQLTIPLLGGVPEGRGGHKASASHPPSDATHQKPKHV